MGSPSERQEFAIHFDLVAAVAEENSCYFLLVATVVAAAAAAADVDELTLERFY